MRPSSPTTTPHFGPKNYFKSLTSAHQIHYSSYYYFSAAASICGLIATIKTVAVSISTISLYFTTA